jgi:hypothetical protein
VHRRQRDRAHELVDDARANRGILDLGPELRQRVADLGALVWPRQAPAPARSSSISGPPPFPARAS